MGKRELLIIAAFLAVGTTLYWVTAPPATEPRGMTLGRLINDIREDIRSDANDADVTNSGTIDVGAAVAELRISGATGDISIVGEDRTDIAYRLLVNSTGPDEASATEYATRTVLVEDDLGETLGLRVSYPEEGRQRTEIVLAIPRRLGLRIEGSNSYTIKDLASLRLDGTVGDTTIERIAGEVTGSHRSGRLTVSGAQSVALTLVSSRAEFTDITGGLDLNVTRGDTRIRRSSGAIEIEQSNTELLIEEHTGTIQVGGSRGQIEIIDPRDEVRVDVRRTEIEIALGVAVPMTIVTTEEPLRVIIDGTPGVTIDAIVTGSGDIVARDFDLTSEKGQDQTSLRLSLSDPVAAHVSLRNHRDDIVLRKRK